jgi:hypothetical protein
MDSKYRIEASGCDWGLFEKDELIATLDEEEGLVIFRGGSLPADPLRELLAASTDPEDLPGFLNERARQLENYSGYAQGVVQDIMRKVARELREIAARTAPLPNNDPSTT